VIRCARVLDDRGSDSYIHHVIVTPTHQECGIGGRIMDAVVAGGEISSPNAEDRPLPERGQVRIIAWVRLP